MKKKLGYLLFIIMTFFSTAFADIIDVPYPDLPPKPIPAPAPEPVDDGEVVVIKTLLCIAIVLMMMLVYYKKSNRIRE